MEKEPCPKCGKTSNMSNIISIPEHGHCPFVKCDWVRPVMREHVGYKCPEECGGCVYCDGGLVFCDVCHGFEGTLTTECCGRPITPYEENRIYNEANLDYNGGKWINKPNYPRHPKEVPGTRTYHPVKRDK